MLDIPAERWKAKHQRAAGTLISLKNAEKKQG
jgi:hypothetical protein